MGERFRRLGRLLRYGRLAAASVASCAPMLLVSRPETSLRVLCIGAFEYAARLQGRRLHRESRRALARACDLGALRNDYYDQHRLDREACRELRRHLRCRTYEAATLRYTLALRETERSRPRPVCGRFPEPVPVVEYRNRVLATSLAWLDAISGRPLSPHQFRALLALVGLIQLVDDLLDWKDDWACRRPTYVTAFLQDGPRPSRPTAARLQTLAAGFRARLAATAERHAETAPFAIAGAFVWLLAIGLMKIRFAR